MDASTFVTSPFDSGPWLTRTPTPPTVTIFGWSVRAYEFESEDLIGRRFDVDDELLRSYDGLGMDRRHLGGLAVVILTEEKNECIEVVRLFKL